MIEVEHLRFSYGKKNILNDVSFTLEAGRSLCILGENGCGKSTLLRCMLGILPFQGKVRFQGQLINEIPRKTLARKMAYIPQRYHTPFAYRVIDMLLMGRLAHKKTLQGFSQADYAICQQALAQVNIPHLHDKLFTELSGGQQQLVYIARALTTQAKMIFMDEPTNGLDFGNQIRLLELIQRLQTQGYSFVITTHHPRQAQFLDTAILMIKQGKVLAFGEQALLQASQFSILYDIDYQRYGALL
ncbi:ABC transporter ATP-binding protein [Pasteurellaceae bacterium HPA106]|uniref:ABC transporter ATP-binding protein n=1 Tax=Spirabiliibacterium pneumoniae TaxID=221400 RepID=UPI001AAD1417|nr:ABC transporter ATP-binding protein [Spirabiliibacterium pneumoniae]MBE2896625.1 ABC transporter ATP-binding protein [Spirabiliibacterium pneumoniae]